ETKLGDDVLGPAEPVGVAREAAFRREHPIAAGRCGHAQKVGFMAKQPKPTLDLPGDAKVAGPGELSTRGVERRQRQQNSETKGGDLEMAHDGGQWGLQSF